MLTFLIKIEFKHNVPFRISIAKILLENFA